MTSKTTIETTELKNYLLYVDLCNTLLENEDVYNPITHKIIKSKKNN